MAGEMPSRFAAPAKLPAVAAAMRVCKFKSSGIRYFYAILLSESTQLTTEYFGCIPVTIASQTGDRTMKTAIIGIGNMGKGLATRLAGKTDLIVAGRNEQAAHSLAESLGVEAPQLRMRLPPRASSFSPFPMPAPSR